MKRLHLIRYKLMLPLHLKASGFKWYKTWSEFRFSNTFHVLFLSIYLLGFVAGVGSGLYTVRPTGVNSAESVTRTHTFIEASCSGNYITGVKYHPTDNNIAYFACSNDRIIKKIDLSTNVTTVIGSTTGDPMQIDITSDGRYVYSANSWPGSIDRFDTTDNSKLNVFVEGGSNAPAFAQGDTSGLLLSADNNLLYVGSLASYSNIYSLNVTNLSTENPIAIENFNLLAGGTERCNFQTKEICDGLGGNAKLNSPVYLEWINNDTIIFYDEYDNYSFRLIKLVDEEVLVDNVPMVIKTGEVTTPFADTDTNRYSGFYYDQATKSFWAGNNNDYNSPSGKVYNRKFDIENQNYNLLETVSLSQLVSFANLYVTGVDMSPDKKTLLVSAGEENKLVKISLVEEQLPELDKQPPIISDITVTNKTFGTFYNVGKIEYYVNAIIKWTTNEPASSTIGISSCRDQYEQTQYPIQLVTFHSVQATALKPGSICQFYVKSQDVYGNISKTQTYTFETPKSPEVTVPDEKYSNKPIDLKPPVTSETSLESSNTQQEEVTPIATTETQAQSLTIVEKIAEGVVAVQGAFRDVINSTPEPVAKTFPYLLISILLVSAYVFFLQAKKEAENAKSKLDILGLQKLIISQKENFVNLASHYLRTPITLIRNGIDVAEIKDKAKKIEAMHVSDKLADDSKALLQRIETNDIYKNVKKPDVVKEEIKSFLSPFIVLPVLLIASIVIYSNYVFFNFQKIDSDLVNFLAQGFVFVVAVQVFVYFARNKHNVKVNIKNFNELEKYQLAVDDARSDFMVALNHKINADIHKVKNLKIKNEFVDDGVKRLEDLIEKIKIMSNFSVEDIKNETKEYQISEIIKKIVSANKEAAEKKISVEVQAENVLTAKNKKIMTEVLGELVDNAVKFSPSNNQVWIQALQKGKKIEIKIKDNGLGISKSDQDQLFKPFSRTGSALDFDHEGSGLGLYYAKVLVNLVGGDLSISSKVGKGTTVIITLI